MNSQDFNCPQCSPFDKKDKGCTKDTPIPRRWEIGGGVYRRCPVKLVTAFTWHCIELYGHYKNGFLLQSGGIIDQQAKYLQIMQIIQGEMNSQQKE